MSTALVGVASALVFTLLTDADVYAPQPLGVCHVLLAAGRVAWIGTEPPTLDPALDVLVVPLDGRRVLPGLVDGHVHITGGGGEAGPASSVPAPPISAYTAHGVTTVIGLLGTDDVARRPTDVLARVHALRAEGLHAWMLTAGYHLPPASVRSTIAEDLVLFEPVLGVGEIAVSDHRSSVPDASALLALASQVRSAALLAGKRGTVHLHLGDHPDGLAPLRAAIATAQLPDGLWHPTHVNRQPALLDDAARLALDHPVRVDVTAFPVTADDPAVPAADAIRALLDAGVPVERISCSSDAGGSIPMFDDQGQLTSFGVGGCGGLLDTLRALVADGLSLAHGLVPFTASPADQLGLADVGHIRVGAHADLLVVDEDLRATDVLVSGRFHLRDGQQVVRGTFEPGTS